MEFEGSPFCKHPIWVQEVTLNAYISKCWKIEIGTSSVEVFIFFFKIEKCLNLIKLDEMADKPTELNIHVNKSLHTLYVLLGMHYEKYDL